MAEDALRTDVRAGDKTVGGDQRAGLVTRREGGPDAPGEQVVGCLQVALGRPDVDPVALGGEAVEAGTDELREDLALEGDGAAVGSSSITSRSTT